MNFPHNTLSVLSLETSEYTDLVIKDYGYLAVDYFFPRKRVKADTCLSDRYTFSLEVPQGPVIGLLTFCF